MSDDEFKDCEEGDADEFQDQPEEDAPTSNLPDEEQKAQDGLGPPGESIPQVNQNADDNQPPSNDLNMMDVPDEEAIQSNPHIWSHTVSVGPNSFCDNRQPYQGLAPPPKYFDGPELQKQFALPTEQDQILKGFEYPECGALVCTDQEMLNKQKGVLAHVVKQLAVNMLKGLSISHISMPIKIFEAKSSIQRMCDLWTNAPKYLRRAADTTDPLERFKLVITFAMSSIYLCCGQNKPFNPLLGETLQGEFYDGSKYYCEHTSHHPPITNFLLEDVQGKYKMYGYYEIVGKLGATNLVSGLRGPNTIEFHDGTKIRFGFPSYKLGGTVYGDRTVEAIGSQVFEDLTNNLKCVITLNTYKKSGWIMQTAQGVKDEYVGMIYETKKQLKGDAKSIGKNYGKDMEMIDDIKSKNITKDVKKEICLLQGSWLKNIIIDDKEYWNIEEVLQDRQIIKTDSSVLPSDWRYREDLVWLKLDEELIAHQWKIRLEVQQRLDRSNRQNSDKQDKKSKKKEKKSKKESQ